MRSLRNFKFMGETWKSWGEILQELSWAMLKRLFLTGLLLGSLYALVKFIKWAWYN